MSETMTRPDPAAAVLRAMKETGRGTRLSERDYKRWRVEQADPELPSSHAVMRDLGGGWVSARYEAVESARIAELREGQLALLEEGDDTAEGYPARRALLLRALAHDLRALRRFRVEDQTLLRDLGVWLDGRVHESVDFPGDEVFAGIEEAALQHREREEELGLTFSFRGTGWLWFGDRPGPTVNVVGDLHGERTAVIVCRSLLEAAVIAIDSIADERFPGDDDPNIYIHGHDRTIASVW